MLSLTRLKATMRLYPKGVVLDIIDIIDESRARHNLINVQLVALALKDKMKLGRDKDKEYMSNLIANLVSL